jgi:hypothetical protein
MASPILSVSQRNSLEVVHTTLTGLRTFIEALDSPLTPNDKEMAKYLCLLSELCERKLVTDFPQLRIWPREWDVNPSKGMQA